MTSKLFSWQKGRQASGYDKMLVCRMLFPLKFDVYLIKFPQGSEIKPHTDVVKTGRHFRINIVLKHAAKGGEFMCENPIINYSRVKFFRPDIEQHQVLKIEQGTRYILSIGWIKK